MKKPIVTPAEHKCPECMGTGYVLTEENREILIGVALVLSIAIGMVLYQRLF